MKKKDWLIFIIGVLSVVPIRIIGRVYIAELVIFLIYPYISWRGYKKYHKITKLMLYGSLWIMGAIITDFVRETPIIDAIKGITSTIFLISLIPFACWALKDNVFRYKYFYYGYVISTQLSYYFFLSQQDFGTADIWRYYSYVSIANLVAVVLYMKGKHILSYMILLGFSFWFLFNGSRNVFITSTVSVTIMFLIDIFKKQGDSELIERYQKRVPVVIISLFITLLAVDSIYEPLAARGTLGELAYNKYWKQKTDGDLGLASGRAQVFMCAELIAKKPIIGYGSFARDKTGFVDDFYSRHNMIDKDEDPYDLNMLPRHSRIMGLWMWHGIGAGVFWIYVLIIFMSTLKNGYFLYNPKLICLAVVNIISETWTTIFSPMGERLPLVFLLVFLIIAEKEYKTKKLIK